MNEKIESRADRPRGAMTALVTPFDERGRLDRPSLASLVSRQIDAGIHGLVPCGTTGESATLDPQEQRQVIETCVTGSAGRVPIFAGCGSNNTRRTVEAARRAADAGADGLLVITPYYVKPNRSGMLVHYETVAGATDLPLLLYNVPGRTGQNLGVELTLELARIPGIVGTKEASGDLDQIGAILERRPPGFAVFSGDDSLTLPTLSLGGDGVISVVSNQAPDEMARLVISAMRGDFSTAREIHFRLLPLMRANFLESNPVPVKATMALLGLCNGRLRPPLGPPEPQTMERLREALNSVGLHEAHR